MRLFLQLLIGARIVIVAILFLMFWKVCLSGKSSSVGRKAYLESLLKHSDLRHSRLVTGHLDSAYSVASWVIMVPRCPAGSMVSTPSWGQPARGARGHRRQTLGPC